MAVHLKYLHRGTNGETNNRLLQTNQKIKVKKFVKIKTQGKIVQLALERSKRLV